MGGTPARSRNSARSCCTEFTHCKCRDMVNLHLSTHAPKSLTSTRCEACRVVSQPQNVAGAGLSAGLHAVRRPRVPAGNKALMRFARGADMRTTRLARQDALRKDQIAFIMQK